jgi:hypothetical protein
MTLKKLITTTLLTLILSQLTYAQPKTGKFLHATAGLGISTATYEDETFGGSGFYAQAEYVNAVTKWFGFRPYVGVIFTSPSENENFPDSKYSATSNALMLGAKVRVCAPIPYVAPYLETGLGLSIGKFETYTPATDIKKNDVITHIPFTLGAAVGRKHLIEIAFTYYFQPSVDQYSGAAAVGVSFALDEE